MINDITMCASTTCPLTTSCLRHADSGVKPDPKYQSYTLFQPDENGNCEYFLEKFDESIDEPSVSIWKV